ncbi:MAG: type II toxin-antitoxin system prevent-host-death family antitoxin [Candidatus Poribacteria bacterium]|nr:type II toxin-antitoxin system prevent-host-death family antitoxin [Candidatus Poribacteria bacterium]
MIEIGVHEAKTHLSKLLKRVENGEEFSITNRGKVVAIVTSPKAERKAKAEKTFGKLLALIETYPIATVEEVIAWKNEGRK